MRKLSFNQENPFIEEEKKEKVSRSLHQSLKNLNEPRGPAGDHQKK